MDYCLAGKPLPTPNSGSNVGAIVGGVVGGVIGLLLLAIAAVLIYQKFFKNRSSRDMTASPGPETVVTELSP